MSTGKDEVGELTRAFDQLQLMFNQTQSQQPQEEDIPRASPSNRELSNSKIVQIMDRMAQEIQENRNDMQLLLDARRLARPNTTHPVRCFFCKQPEAHTYGTVNCPDAQALVKEGLCVFRNGRIYMTDNSEFPRTAPGKSMAVAIRSVARMRRSNLSQNRTASTRTPQVAFAQLVSKAEPTYVSDDGQETGEANQALWENVFVADRTQTSNNRFNPIGRENRRTDWKRDKAGEMNIPKTQPYVELPPVPRKWGASNHPIASMPAPDSAPREEMIPNNTRTENDVHMQPARVTKFSTRPAVEIPAPTRDKLPEAPTRSSIKKTDFVLKGDPHVPNPGPEKVVTRNPSRTRFTTNMREVYDDQTIYQKFLGTEVALPLGAILAISPGLEKKITADTKLHNVK